MSIVFTGLNSNLYRNFSTKFLRDCEDYPNEGLVLIGFKSPREPLENTLELYNENLFRLSKDLNELCTSRTQVIVLFSAISVYGNNWDGRGTQANPNPGDHYSLAKLEAERLVEAHCRNYNIRNYIFRLPGIYANGSSRNFISRVRDCIREGEEFFVSKITHQFNNFTTIDQVEHLLLKVLKVRPNQHIFNLGASIPVSIKELITIFESRFNTKARFCVDESIAERIIDTYEIDSLLGRKYDAKSMLKSIDYPTG